MRELPEGVALVENGASPAWFLSQLFGRAEQGMVTIFEKKTKRSTRFALNKLSEIDAFVAGRRNLGTIYANIGLQTLTLSADRRGKLHEIWGITCLWADLDLPKTDCKKIYPSYELAMAALNSMPLRSSMLVFSGGGFYPLWLLNEVLVVGNDERRAREVSATLVNPWQDLLRRRLKSLDPRVELDGTGDVTRDLRLAGSLNQRTGHTVAVVEYREVAYDVSDFEEFLPRELPCSKRNAQCRINGHTVKLPVDRKHNEIEGTERFNSLLVNDSRFAETWARNRPELQDQSASAYCYSLTAATIRAGWPDESIDDLIYAWRQKHDELDGYEARKVANDIRKQRDAVVTVAPAKVDSKNASERVRAALSAGGPSAIYCDGNLLDSLAAIAVQSPDAYAGLRHELREAKVRIRDFDSALKPRIQSLAKSQPPASAFDDTGGFYYDEATGTICRTKYVSGVAQKMSLSNFDARIVDETVYDDGAERKTVFGVEGKLCCGRALPRVEVPAERFCHPESWVVAGWGSDAIVWPGEGRALAPAIQALSRDKLRRTTFTHTGWRKFGDVWAYLHAGGAIGPASWNEFVDVSLRGSMACYRLPEPPTDGALSHAVRASLGTLRLGPDCLTMPLLAAVYRSVLGPVDTSLYYVGASGSFKSEFTALGQQHFGAEFSRLRLPGNWQSTANALEGLSFIAKDAVFTIDDFAPKGSSIDVARMHKDADRIFRGQGNNSGRQRMCADGTPRADKYPRGLVVSSGEDVPRGYSARARMWIVEMARHDVNVVELSRCQAEAAAGRYAESMAGYLHWLAPQYEALRTGLAEAVVHIRSQVETTANHARTPHIVAELFVGFDWFVRFAAEVGAISSGERNELRERCWRSLCRSADAQAAMHRAHEPAQHFVRLLMAALATSRVHLAGPHGGEPDTSPQAWGWREITVGAGQYMRRGWQPQGRLVGWLNSPHVYLDADAAFAEVQKFAEDQGETMTISATMMGKRLNEGGYLRTTDLPRGTLTVRRKLQGQVRNVWHLDVTRLAPDEADEHAEGDVEPAEVGNVGF